MAQIDMSKFKKETVKPDVISDTIEELKASEQPETGNEPVELTDNALEKLEDTNEIKPEQKAEEEKKTVVVMYVGNGVWKDSDGKLWSNENKTQNIVNERRYTLDEYESREDIKFMVGYGAMKAIFV